MKMEDFKNMIEIFFDFIFYKIMIILFVIVGVILNSVGIIVVVKGGLYL